MSFIILLAINLLAIFTIFFFYQLSISKSTGKTFQHFKSLMGKKNEKSEIQPISSFNNTDKNKQHSKQELEEMSKITKFQPLLSAKEEYSANNIDKAEKILNSNIKEVSSIEQLHIAMTLTELSYKDKNYSKALNLITEVINKSGKSYINNEKQLQYLRGKILLNMGEHEEAKKDFHIYIKENNNPISNENINKLFEEKGFPRISVN